MEILSVIDSLISRLEGKSRYKSVLAAVNKARTIVQDDLTPPYFDGRKLIIDHIIHYAKTLDDPRSADLITGFASILAILGSKNENSGSESLGS